MAQGIVMFFVSLSCLNEEEFQTASVAMGLAPGERENFLCVLDQVGGQDALAALLIPSAEFPAELFQSGVQLPVSDGQPAAGLGTAGAPGSPIGVGERRAPLARPANWQIYGHTQHTIGVKARCPF